MNEQQAPNRDFAPYTARAATAERVAFVLLLLLAAFLRLHRLRQVPPGIHDDEVINAQIAEQLEAGGPVSIFYEAGEGREGLYFLLLAASRALISRVPDWYRLPSVALSLLTIPLVHRLWRRRFGPWAALTAAGGLAVIYWPVHLGRGAYRVLMVPLLASAMMLALWRGLERPTGGRRALQWFLLAGSLLGLAQYTYPAARVMPLFVVLFIAYLALFHRDRLRLHWRGFALLLVVAALIAIPLALYLGRHWEQQQRILSLSGPVQALLAGDFGSVLPSTAATMGMFFWQGDPLHHYNLPGRPVFEPVGGLLFLGGVLLALLTLRRPASAFCLLWTATALLPGMVSEPAPHFTRTAGIHVTVFLFPGLAARWLANHLKPKGRTFLAAGLGLLAIANAGLTYRDYFLRWPTVEGARGFHHSGLAEVARYLDDTEDTTPLAVCTPFLNEQHFFWRTDRQALPYLMNRRDLEIGWYSCLESQLFVRGGASGRYLFGNRWEFAAFVPPRWVEETEVVATFQDNYLMRMEIEDRLDAWLDQFARPDASSPTFGETMTFLGHRPRSPDPAPGQELELLTAWRVQAPPPRELAIFLHLLDGDGRVVAQGDALSALSDSFRPGDIFVQRHTIALPADIAPGPHRLATGLYVRGSGRLSLEPSDVGTDDALMLSVVEVQDDRD